MKHKLIAAVVLIGCAAIGLFALPISYASGPDAPAKEVTFNKDVAPIFHAKCAECHHPGETAPFSTLTYKDVRPWAKSIKEKVINREMPPWHADPQVGEWANDRRLTPQQIETIVAWVNQGAKEGDPKDLPPAPQFIDGWSIGKPDVVISMTEEF
ncbi:MAG TPA: c-type cytochrome, partial [Blastocatellia bacterium]|nr:c-type cytochrome [Blastocatellia bacterium]